MEASDYFQGQQPFLETSASDQEVNVYVVEEVSEDEEADEPPRFGMYVNGVKVCTIDVDVFSRLDITTINRDGTYRSTGIKEAIVTTIDSEIVERNGYLELGAASLSAAVKRVYPEVTVFNDQPVEEPSRL